MQRERANGKKIPPQVLSQNRKSHIRVLTFVILTVAVALGIFAVASAAVSRFGWKLDLTENRLFELTDVTTQALEELTQPVELIYCNAQSNADTNIREVLSRYEAASAYVQATYLDLDANPAVFEQWSRKYITLSEDGVLVVSGEQAQFIQWSELYAINSYTDESGTERYSLSGLQAESKLTAAIVAVTTASTKQLVFTAGHSEDAPQTLFDTLENSNYQAEQIVLGVEPLENTVSTIVIAGAKRDFSEKELQVLDDFMTRGGNLMVFRQAQIGQLPNLDSYLRAWGLQVEDQLVLEPKQQMDSPLNIIPSFGVSMINVYFSEQSTYLVLPECRALSLNNVNGCITNTVLRSTTSAYGKDYASMTTLTQAETDAKGPFTVAAISEKSNANTASGTQYVFLTACTGLYQDNYLQMESLGNTDLILQVLAYMNDTDVVLNIPVKSLSVGQIAISRQMTIVFAVVFVGILPLLLLVFGAVVFLKRRYT